MTLGELVAFFSLIWYIIGPMWGIGFQINNYTQSKASGERVLELLNAYVHVKNVEDAVVLSSDQVKGHVRFDNVTFQYAGKDALCRTSHSKLRRERSSACSAAPARVKARSSSC